MEANVKDQRTISLTFKDFEIDHVNEKDLLHMANEGGMGISMMTKIMDEVSYFYTSDKRNLLRLSKEFQ